MTSHIHRYDTEDGSTTLYDSQLDVHYRSTHGAKTESMTVFIHGTRLPQRQRPWTVLELGFGSAVNFMQTVEALLERTIQQPGHLTYHAVEYAPVQADDLAHLPGPHGALARQAIDALQGSMRVHVNTQIDGLTIDLTLHRCAWDQFDQPTLKAHAIYHDPFGPKTNPQGWTVAAFEVAAKHLADDGVLATYSAAGHVRRAMRDARLFCATSPGPGFKREITFAAHHRQALSHATIIEKYAPK